MSIPAVKPNLTLRTYIDSDYTTLIGWWKHYNWPSPPQDFLPETGYIVEVDGKPAGAVFVYKTNSKAVLMEWLVTDPTTDKEIRDTMVSDLIEIVAHTCALEGFKYIYTCVKLPKLISRLENHGFSKADEGMSNMIRRVL